MYYVMEVNSVSNQSDIGWIFRKVFNYTERDKAIAKTEEECKDTFFLHFRLLAISNGTATVIAGFGAPTVPAHHYRPTVEDPRTGARFICTSLIEALDKIKDYGEKGCRDKVYEYRDGTKIGEFGPFTRRWDGTVGRWGVSS